jgi:hypothetical protein
VVFFLVMIRIVGVFMCIAYAVSELWRGLWILSGADMVLDGHGEGK